MMKKTILTVVFACAIALGVQISTPTAAEAADHWVSTTSKAEIYVRDETAVWSCRDGRCDATLVCVPKYGGKTVFLPIIFMVDTSDGTWLYLDRKSTNRLTPVYGFYADALEYLFTLR